MTHTKAEFDELFEIALTLEILEDGDEIEFEDLKELLEETIGDLV